MPIKFSDMQKKHRLQQGRLHSPHLKITFTAVVPFILTLTNVYFFFFFFLILHNMFFFMLRETVQLSKLYIELCQGQEKRYNNRKKRKIKR